MNKVFWLGFFYGFLIAIPVSLIVDALYQLFQNKFKLVNNDWKAVVAQIELEKANGIYTKN